jgi:FkbM family methyltransferase
VTPPSLVRQVASEFASTHSVNSRASVTHLIQRSISRFRRHVLGHHPPVSPWIAMGREYDRQTKMVLRRVLSANSSCLDIGANVGDILQLMTRFAPKGRHHAFEAIPGLAQNLARRFPMAKVHAVAVSDRVGTSTFCLVANAPAWSGLLRRNYDIQNPDVQEIEVPLARIDDLVPADERFRLVKIDIEGGEFHALRGARETIRRSRPYLVMEAGRDSTGRYGVSASDMYELVVGDLGLDLTTMFRWLTAAPLYSRSEFLDNWEHGPDFYFMGVPRGGVG